MGSQKGFTIIEIALVITILGVFAAHALIKYQKTIAFNELEKSANRAYLDLRALRAQAFKWDTLVITKFYSDSFEAETREWESMARCGCSLNGRWETPLVGWLGRDGPEG